MTFRPRAGYTRRTFLKDAALLAAAALPLGSAAAQAMRRRTSDKNADVVAKKFRLASDRSLEAEPMGDVMAAIGLSFIGTPYVAHTLEVPGPEHLVVNLQGLDCTTFVENVLALSRTVKLKQTGFEVFT